MRVSYVSVESKGEVIEYGTKLIIRNGKFHQLLQGQIKEGNKLDGYGKTFYNIERTKYYVGEWLDGKRNGRGVFNCPEYHYSGEYENDWMTGVGKLTWPNGAYYEGQLKKARFEGHARYVDVHGNEYIGTYSDHKRNGRGIYKKVNGDIYEGTWKNGEELTGILTRTKHNNCVVKYKDGHVVNDPNSCNVSEHN